MTPLSLSIDCGGTERMYTGEPWLPTPTATYQNGPHAGETVSGTRLSGGVRRLLASAPLGGGEPGLRFRFDLFTGDTVDLTVTGVKQGVGTHTLSGSVVSSVGDSLTASFTGTTLTVKANETPITLTAVSAEKIYDGEALTADGVTVTGLPSGFTCAAAVSGSQTDAGESTNTVASYAILDAEEKDVTAFFTGITTAPGKLTVKPAPLTVTTGSASKVYDGTALTALATVSGLVSADEGKVTVTATGAQTAVGSASNAYTIDWGTAKTGNYALSETIGTLTVKANDTPITLTAVSAEKVYDGEALTADGVTATGLPAGFTCAATASGSQTDAGESANTVASYVILDAEETDVTAFFTGITTAAGKLTVKPAPLTVTTGSASKVYDGTALTAPATVSGLVSADEGKVTVTATGTLTVTRAPLTSAGVTVSGLTKLDAGKVTVAATGAITGFGAANNTCSIDWGGVNPGNYTVTQTLGTLKITATNMPITVTSADAEGVYTPFGLSNSGYTVEGLPEGFTLTAEVTGSLSVPGTAHNTIASYSITDGGGADVTEYFTGVPASLFMMMTSTLIHYVAGRERSPAKILTAVNAEICSRNPEEMFITVWLGVLELSTGILTAANAGHEYPALRRPDGRFELFKDRHGFVIGGMEGVRYREYTLPLSPGTKLFVYTDGVPEATDAREEMFGTDRMLDALRTHEQEAPEAILAGVSGAVSAFVGAAPQFDDLTMLCLAWNGGEPSG